MHAHMGTQYIFAQSCCNFSHIFGQDILKVVMIFFFDSFILFLFWWYHNPKI